MRRFLQLAPRVYVTTLISAAALAVYLGPRAVAWAQDRPLPASALGGAAREQLWRGELWRLPLNTLHHANLVHVGFNLYVFWILGAICELAIGSWRYALFLLGAALATTAASELTIEQGAIGLSGVLFAVFGLMLHLRKRNVFCAQALPPRAIQFLIGWLFLCILLTVTGILPIANVAHFSGLIYGWLAGWAFYSTHRWLRTRRAGFVVAHALLIPAGLYIWRPVYDASYHFYLGVEAKDPAVEMQEYRRALELRPDFPEAQFNLGLASYDAGRFDEAQGSLGRFLGEDLKSPDLRERVGDALHLRILALDKLKRYDEIPAALSRLEEADPSRGLQVRAELFPGFQVADFLKRLAKAWTEGEPEESDQRPAVSDQKPAVGKKGP